VRFRDRRLYEAMEIAESMIKRARAEMAMRQEQGFVKLP